MALFRRGRDEGNVGWTVEKTSSGDLFRWRVHMENIGRIPAEHRPVLEAAARKQGQTLHDYVSWVAHLPKDQLHQRRDRIMTGQATEEEATLYNAWLDTRIAVQEVQYRMMRRPGEWVWS